MDKREKLAAGPLLLGLLFCTSGQLIGSAIGVALLGIGALALHLPQKARQKRRRTRRTAGRVSHDLSL